MEIELGISYFVLAVCYEEDALLQVFAEAGKELTSLPCFIL